MSRSRPDTTGPYYKPVTWPESDKIAEVLKESLKTKANAIEMQKFVHYLFVEHGNIVAFFFSQVTILFLQVSGRIDERAR